MAEVTMTLYEALAKKKILEDRVKRMQSCRLVGVKYTHKDMTTDGKTPDELSEIIKSGYDSTIALVNNLITLKAAINEANAKIKVTISGKEYTIANAIAKFRGIDTEINLYNKMILNINACKKDIETNKERYLEPDSISNYVSKVLGDSKKDDALVKVTEERYKTEHEMELFDPLNTEELATKKLEELENFKEQIHYVLTQANCTNSITVNFED